MTYFFTPTEQLIEIFSFWTPTQEKLNTEIAAYRGSYIDQMKPRVAGAIELQSFLFLIENIWRVLSMMILGMILFRNKTLSAGLTTRKYRNLFFSCFTIGLFISASGLYRSYDKNWDGIWVMNIGHHYNYIASVFMAIAYISLIMLWSKFDFLSGLKNRLKAAGRMAFTNYIFSSIVCTFIFYGHGLGFFGKLNRLECWLVIILVWLAILILSPLILKRYKQGPLEWLWRKLTYL